MLLPEIEGWIKAAGALVAVAMALLVPIRSWVTEDRRYRAQALNALAATSRSTIAAVSGPGPSSLLADTLAISALADALNRVASAVERLTEHTDARDRDRLTRAIERLVALQEER